MKGYQLACFLAGGLITLLAFVLLLFSKDGWPWFLGVAGSLFFLGVFEYLNE